MFSIDKEDGKLMYSEHNSSGYSIDFASNGGLILHTSELCIDNRKRSTQQGNKKGCYSLDRVMQKKVVPVS